MYRYPDYDDRNLTQNVINEDWEDFGLEEKYIIESIELFPKKYRNYLLDAGCGLGRLLPYFQNIFKNIFAVDPDPYRLTIAKRSFSSSLNINFINTFIQDFSSPNKFDFIVCSHVVQHLHTKEVKTVLEKLRNLMKPHAYLMFSTTNWPEDIDQFEIRDTLTNKFKIVSEQKFNECVKKCDRHLPTRHFSEKTLIPLLAKTRFDIIFLKKYHGFPKIRGDNFILAKKSGD